jgi:phosphatidate cytidylyltransferase
MTPLTGAGRLPATAAADGAGALLWGALAIAAACAPWLGEGVVIVGFAAVSWWALRMFPLPPQRGPADRVLAAACLASVPLQYGFVATHAYEPFIAVLPLASLMVLPLLALASGNTRNLLDRIAERGFVVMLCVYCVAHAPALLMLEVSVFAGHNGLLVAFLIVAAHAGDIVRHVLCRLRRRQGLWLRARVGTELPATVVLGALAGSAFAAVAPIPAGLAGATGAGIAVLGWLGRAVLARLREECAPVAAAGTVWDSHIARPDALCFAAPVLFHLLRAA